MRPASAVLRVGPFVVEVFDEEASEVNVTYKGKSVLWVDDFGGEPSIYLHHTDDLANDPQILRIERGN